MKTVREWDIHPDEPLPELDGDGWLAVSEQNAGRFWVRVAETADGRLVIMGIHMSGEREITANTLRAIQPAAILKTIAWRESGGTPPPSVGAVDPTTELARFEGVSDEIAAIVATAPRVAAESKRGRRAPSRSDLERFASVYLGFYRAGKADPVKQTTRALNISRATAHRRIDACRRLGLIPPREDNR